QAHIPIVRCASVRRQTRPRPARREGRGVAGRKGRAGTELGRTGRQMTGGAEAKPGGALLGTGIMGAGMGRNLLRAGLPLRVWNRSRERAEPLAGDGAVVAGRPADAVDGADVIVTMLADGPAVAQVMSDAEPGLAAGQVWVQASTVGIDWTDQLAGLGRDRGLGYLD